MSVEDLARTSEKSAPNGSPKCVCILGFLGVCDLSLGVWEFRGLAVDNGFEFRVWRLGLLYRLLRCNGTVAMKVTLQLARRVLAAALRVTTGLAWGFEVSRKSVPGFRIQGN